MENSPDTEENLYWAHISDDETIVHYNSANKKDVNGQLMVITSKTNKRKDTNVKGDNEMN